MIGKFFTSFAIIFSYLLIPFPIALVMKELFFLPESAIIGLVIVFVIGFFPLMIFVSRKVFLFPAKHKQSIAKADLIKQVAHLRVKDCLFSAEYQDDCLVLTSPYMDAQFVSLFQAQNISKAYYMKLWFDEDKHLVRFKDHLVSSASAIGAGGISFNMSAQTGYVSSQVFLLDSSANLVRFSNAELHKALIEVVTSNGWSLNLKII
ncbi:hypothetical protein [Shewanella fidelis]|uniref:Uncharacterized protein n=1 Tax=Shewanella fidelis TaxID=173509 RepID=A0AAW8NK82_9GAMM|nr:hypothetical protein [Shewanella fidelis]MDR8522735.1 hypothetical protein [Shewanella fidelis]MDW4812350.1 hypothetical protein [Shewanella fidelis]MDW4815985.1 hypothetical protein [Shewanella fidelis]MDW4820591.1 hypothetical protein [Shewanella fidelis]MDW4824814.1 hypothetical protein [Shewanella fidelis]